MPDLKYTQFPEKEFLFAILSTLMLDGIRMLLLDTKNKKAPINTEDQSNLIEVNKEFAESIDILLSIKSKQNCLDYIKTATKREQIICLKCLHYRK